MSREICGECKWHIQARKIHEHIKEFKLSDEFVCTNGDSEYYIDYTDYTDTCEQFEQRGIE